MYRGALLAIGLCAPLPVAAQTTPAPAPPPLQTPRHGSRRMLVVCHKRVYRSQWHDRAVV